MYVPFEQMPGEGRVWIFAAVRPFSARETDTISSVVRAFCEQWDSHGSPLKASFRIDHGRFLLLAVDDRHLGPGGCSIDKCFQMIRGLEARVENTLLERDWIAVKKGDHVEMIKLREVKDKIANGALTADTEIVDTTVNILWEWRTRGCVRAGDSWLKRYWSVQQTPA